MDLLINRKTADINALNLNLCVNTSLSHDITANLEVEVEQVGESAHFPREGSANIIPLQIKLPQLCSTPSTKRRNIEGGTASSKVIPTPNALTSSHPQT